MIAVSLDAYLQTLLEWRLSHFFALLRGMFLDFLMLFFFDAYNRRHYVWIAELKPPDMWVSTTSANREIVLCKHKVHICSGRWITHAQYITSLDQIRKTHMMSWNGVSSHSFTHCRGADLTSTGPSMVVIRRWLVTNSVEWDAWSMGRNVTI